MYYNAFMNSAQLKQLREKHGFTQEQAAWGLGLSVETLAGYESTELVPKLVYLACKELYRDKDR